MKTRLKTLIIWAGAFLCIGLIYSYFYRMGIQIPCVYYTLTGLYCPGCGISRMCISLLNFDMKSAFQYNAGVMLALPVITIVTFQLLVQYVLIGSKNLTMRQNRIVWILIFYFILFGILRNLPFFEFLQPMEWPSYK